MSACLLVSACLPASVSRSVSALAPAAKSGSAKLSGTDSAADALPQLGTTLGASSVSGLSSGAYMAGQIEVAHAKDIVGAGIVAGGPYACAETSASRAFPFWPTAVGQNAMQALYSCMKTTMGPPNADDLVARAKELADDGAIDPLTALADPQCLPVLRQ